MTLNANKYKICQEMSEIRQLHVPNPSNRVTKYLQFRWWYGTHACSLQAVLQTVRESHGARNRTSASPSAGPGGRRREEGEGGGRKDRKKRKGGGSRKEGERETKGKGHRQRERERREVKSRRGE